MEEQEAEKPATSGPDQPIDPNQLLDERQRVNTSGLSWDETIRPPGEKWRRATEMGEAD